MLSDAIVVVLALAAAAVLFSKRLERSSTWRATVTPLASIIGSGFLVSVPLLAAEVGNWAILAMIALVFAAYLVGAAIRFNIRYAEPILEKPPSDTQVHITQSLDKLSHFVLAFAYFISVAYYLLLLANFLLNGFGVTDADLARSISTAILAALGCLGFFKGLGMVESVEKYTVGLNLTIIVALLGGLFWYNASAMTEGVWKLSASSPEFDTHAARILLGLLIVVQGFETSRFMGDEYDPETRIKTMRYAQWISAVVYIVFFTLMTYLFRFLEKDSGITGIIHLVGHVALVLPILLTVGAVASQFSASVADSVGCAGLLEDIANRRLNLQHAYPLIAVVSIAITWSTNVFGIITLASQAFALFYLVQVCVALSVAYERRDLRNRAGYMALFLAVALFCLCVVFFGIPSGG